VAHRALAARILIVAETLSSLAWGAQDCVCAATLFGARRADPLQNVTGPLPFGMALGVNAGTTYPADDAHTQQVP